MHHFTRIIGKTDMGNILIIKSTQPYEFAPGRLKSSFTERVHDHLTTLFSEVDHVPA